MELNDEVPLGAADMIDERNFKAEYILGDVFPGELPSEVDLFRKTEAKDQGSSMRCTAYGAAINHQILNSIEHKVNMVFDAEEQWRNQLKFPSTARESIGDYLLSALKSLKKYGLTDTVTGKVHKIDGYATIPKNATSFKKYLAAGYVIYTGAPVTNSNFRKAKHEGLWGGMDGDVVGGHAFVIGQYEEVKGGASRYGAMNSYGKTWGKFKNGTFDILEQDIAHLFTPYVIYDSKDVRMIFKDVSENSDAAEVIEWCAKKGIVNGYGEGKDNLEKLFLPKNPITRAEACYLAKNLFNALKEELRRSK